MRKRSCTRCTKGRSIKVNSVTYASGTYDIALCPTCQVGFNGKMWGWQKYGWDAAPAESPALCDRCDGAATTVSGFILDRERTLFYLCDTHADSLQRDIFAWARDGELTQTDTLSSIVRLAPPPPAPKPKPAPPTAKLTAVPPLMKRKPKPGPDVPATALNWRISSHAEERIAERGAEFGFSRDDVLKTLAWPEVIVDSIYYHKYPGSKVYQRGAVRCVVNPDALVVLTVTPVRLAS